MRGKIFGILAVGMLLALPAMADALSRTVPGALNYVEGQASIGAESLSPRSVGSATLQPNEVLTTAAGGKAEILLTPGAFLRVGGDSAVKMISPSLTNTLVEVQRGEAQVEVDQLFKQNDLQVLEDGATIRMQKRGIYDFNAEQHAMRVLDGQAWVRDGDAVVTVKGGHELALDSPALKPRKFDKDSFKASNDLYRWSSLRSAYLAEASMDQARTYVVNGWYGPGWWGPGWYWSPWFGAYTFIPADGIFYSPFGWGFYSPFWAYRVPLYYSGPFYRHFGPGWSPKPHPWPRASQPYAPAIRGGAPMAPRGEVRGGELHAGGVNGGHGGFGHSAWR